MITPGGVNLFYLTNMGSGLKLEVYKDGDSQNKILLMLVMMKWTLNNLCKIY